MAPIFAPSDVTALLSHFPPHNPRKNQHSLVRSRSGNSLYNSRKVLIRFEDLVESGSGSAGDRIRLDDLPSLLGVKNADWIFECYNGELRFTRDRKAVFSEAAFERIMEELRLEAESAFVDLAAFAKRNDVEIESIQERDLEITDLRRFTDAQPGPIFVSTDEHFSNVISQLQKIATSSSDREVNLSNEEGLSNVPINLLRTFVDEVREGTDQLQGEFEDCGDRIVFVPFAFVEAQAKQQQQAYDDRARTLLSELTTHSFVRVLVESDSDTDQLRKDVFSLYEAEVEESVDRIAVLEINDVSKALVLQTALEEELEALTSVMEQLISGTDNERTRKIPAPLVSMLINHSKRPALAELVLQSQHRSELEATWLALFDKADAIARNRLNTLFQETVMAPLHLYAAAIMGDTTLRQNQDTYMTAFFCNEIIPGFVDTSSEQRFAPKKVDAGRKKDMNQLLESCKAANSEGSTKTFKDVQSAVARFAKKRNMSPPSPSQISAVKKETLRQKGRVIQKMTRGSDLLQNLIWISFAQASDGLYISAGRDTSRMIEQYKAVGEVEIWQKLQRWRDLLKAGKAGEEDLRAMKELALETLEGMGVLEVVGEEERG